MAAYRGMWNAFAAAAKDPGRPYPGLRRFADGRALKLLTNGLREKAQARVVTRGRLVLHPSIAKVLRRDQIKIVDCVDDSHWLEYTANGQPASGPGSGGRHHAEALVSENHDRWRVTAWFVEKAGTC